MKIFFVAVVLTMSVLGLFNPTVVSAQTAQPASQSQDQTINNLDGNATFTMTMGWLVPMRMANVLRQAATDNGVKVQAKRTSLGLFANDYTFTIIGKIGNIGGFLNELTHVNDPQMAAAFQQALLSFHYQTGDLSI